MKEYFYGWYFKCQSDTQTLAIIPAVHASYGKQTFSIQIITEEATWNVIYDEKRMKFTPELKVEGNLYFLNLTPLKYDIMGPFVFVPFMECRHSVYSMKHRVDGKLCINDKEYVFENALGYWEGDRGRSFPKEYAWTQSFLYDTRNPLHLVGSLMLSVADIPLAGVHFTGIIGIVHWKGKEYRFATYLGARVVQKRDGRLLIRQGQMELEARLMERNGHPLLAPVNGTMTRTIRENIRCKAFYRLRQNGQTIFALKTDKASFEFEYN